MEERRKEPYPCAMHDEKINELRDCIFGNGNEGLKVRFIRMEENMKNVKILMYLFLPGIFIGILGIAIRIIFFM